MIGAVGSHLIVDVGKYTGLYTFFSCLFTIFIQFVYISVGRLRPHFFDLCNPQVNGTPVSETNGCNENINGYVLNYTCEPNMKYFKVKLIISIHTK